MHDLGIIIVNWNTRDYLEKCLQTVFASQGNFTFRVVVVDNASTDGSAGMVRQKFSQVQLIVNDSNQGYPRANNVGLRAFGYHGKNAVDADTPRYALLLNPDTEVPPDAFYRMIQFMDSRPDIGVAGPKLILQDGSLDKACRRGFPTPAVSFFHYSGLAKLFPNNPRFGRYNMTFADPDRELEVFIRIPDRGEALYRACQMANAGDIVMVCGKGHEQSMCFGVIEYPWDDRDALRVALRGSPLKTLPTAAQ